MRIILQGLLLSLALVGMNSQAADTNESLVNVTSQSAVGQAPMFNDSEEESDAKTVAEMTAVQPAIAANTAETAAAAQPAEELLAGEMKGIKDTRLETQIPVLTKVEAKSEKTSDPMARLVISFGVILAVAGGIFMFARFWAKRKTGLKQHHQIKVLTQYGLGPKKSLAIIRVAGESMLIGVTDHNITMIKSLALLDEDLPMEVPQAFSQELNHADQMVSQHERADTATFTLNEKEDFNFGSVRDIVASRLREMRSL